MKVYTMHAYTITAPSADNDGEPAEYAGRLRRALLDNGIDGWTETASVGYWRGKREEGTLFTIYRERMSYATLCGLAAWAMIGQEAVQVVYAGTVELAEA